MTIVYLTLSIVCSSLINLIFKSFGEAVDKMSAIVVNYFTCVLVALVVNQENMVFFTDFWNRPWFIYSAGLGVLFISIFYLIALTNQYSGVSVAAAASKLGVIIPVAAGVLIFKEAIKWPVLVAIAISLFSVLLISRKKTPLLKGRFTWIILPMAVLIGSGIIDTTLKYIQNDHLGDSPENHPTTIIFATAGLIGLFSILLSGRRRKALITKNSLMYGMALGIPNYFSILFLLLALNTGELASVVIFPLNNISVVALSAVASIIFFKESMSIKNITGLILAILSIIIISIYQ